MRPDCSLPAGLSSEKNEHFKLWKLEIHSSVFSKVTSGGVPHFSLLPITRAWYSIAGSEQPPLGKEEEGNY